MKIASIHLFVLLFTLVRFSVSSQTDAHVLRLIDIAKAENLAQFQNNLNALKGSFPGERVEGGLGLINTRRPIRSFGRDFCSYSVWIEHTQEINGSSFKPDYYNLIVLFDNADSSIFFKQLLQSGQLYDKSEWSLFLDFDSTQFETYFARHDSLFNTTTERNFEAPPFLSRNYYGPVCPDHGSEQYDQMIEFVDASRKDVFVDWLKSFNLENKVYGAQGLYFLQKKGVKLTEDEQQLIDALKSIRIAQVQTDLGLDYIASLIHESRLDRKYEQYIMSE